MTPPNLPDVARSILKAMIVALNSAGLITMADADLLVQILGLQDA